MVAEPEKHTDESLKSQVVDVQTMPNDTKSADDVKSRVTEISSDVATGSADAPKSKAQIRAERREIQVGLLSH